MSKKVYEAYAVVVGGGAAGSVAAYKLAKERMLYYWRREAVSGRQILRD